MSEVEARTPPSRGRSSVRGARGGLPRGGARGGRRPVNGSANDIDESLDNQGEVGEMKKKYGPELSMLKDMFPDWTDVDLVFALEESDGDVANTVEKITQGNVSQFAEVKTAKDRARSKAKDESAAAGATDKGSVRGGRGRGGFDSTRGGRGRGSDRGRGGFRGARGGHATSDAPKVAATTTESPAWETTTSSEAATGAWDTSAQDTTATASTGTGAWGTAAPAPAAAVAAAAAAAPKPEVTAPEEKKSAPAAEAGAKKSWASMFSQPKPAPIPAPAKQAPKPQPPTQQAPPAVAKAPEPESAPAPVAQEAQPAAVATPDVKPAGSKIPLTEENVEHLPDESIPPATQTAASTAGSVDTRNLTPLTNQPTPIGRPQVGGYAASAYRATAIPGGSRSASFQRKVKEQQEAVVMPGHNAVDRAAVQFGSMGLNGEPGPDVDEEREEPETRQAPQSSPPSQPRTSLPPAPRQSIPAQEMPEGLPAQKQAPGLPPASAQNQQQMQDASGMGQDQSQMNPNYNQYARYGQPGMQHDAGAQKPYDAFGHQAQQTQYDQYGMHAQQAQQGQAGFGGLSSAPSDYSSYYTADQQSRYNQYYGSSYGQQDTRAPTGQQDAGAAQQRSSSGFGAGPNDTAFSSQTQQQQSQSRFGEAPGSGNNTPNPLLSAQQQTAQNPQQSQHMMHQAPGHQQGGYPGASAAFPYGHPYYSSPYQAAYQSQFSYNQPAGYGSGFGGKQGGMYGVPHGYGSSYEQHSASPANAGAFGQNQQASMRSASGMGSGLGGGLDDYTRASTQSAQASGLTGMNDPFARSGSGIGGQAAYGHQGAAQDESLKNFADSKGNPSPALNQPGRPASAANSTVGGTQTSLPAPQSQQSGFGGGYSGFPGQNSQYGGLGGLGNQQQGQQQQGQQQQGQQGQGGMGGYGQYGAGGFGQTYGGYNSRGGWGSNYGAH